MAIPKGLSVALQGATIDQTRAVPGSSSFSTWWIKLADGREAFAKQALTGHPSDFKGEAAGLEWLAETGAVKTPTVLGIDTAATHQGDRWLIIEFVRTATRPHDFDERLGRALAQLHGSPCSSFGFTQPTMVGQIPQDNTPAPTWSEFYGQRRLLPLARQARTAGALVAIDAHRCEQLVARLDQLCGPPEPPSRLHGDLWAGNVLCDAAGCPVLIDPAVYGGHREVDLAMMRLFGGFSHKCFAAYAEVRPLSPGANERIRLYQLYPLLVHALMFGGHYCSTVQRELRYFVG